MLQNAYLDAKIGFETEENEPPKVWRQIFSFFHSPPWSEIDRKLEERRIAVGLLEGLLGVLEDATKVKLQMFVQ